MRKLLLTSAAVTGLALASTPAHAQLELDLGGYFLGYGVFQDSDETGTTAASDDLREYELRRRAEVHFTGETTLDNGLSVGVHGEMLLGHDTTSTAPIRDESNEIDEIYAYFSGNWGRVNLGSEDGAAFLLQVAAPSADANVDGIRTFIQSTDLAVGPTGAVGGFAEPLYSGQNYLLDYDNAPFRDADRLTYLTPKVSGAQAGVSYAPHADNGDPNSSQLNIGGGGLPTFDDNPGEFEDLLEIAGRWDGEFEGVGVSVGAGYSTASTETDAAGTTAVGTDDLDSFNAGLNVSFGAFSVGGAYLESNNGISTSGDTTVYVLGADWTNGPWTAGVSYLDAEHEVNVFGAGGGDVEIDRLTLGGTYTYGPGMSFRGSVAFGESEDTSGSSDFTQVAVGTQVDF